MVQIHHGFHFFCFLETSVTLQQNHQMSQTLTFIGDFLLHCSRQNTISQVHRGINTCFDHQLHKNCSILCNFLLALLTPSEALAISSIIPTELISVVGKSYRTKCILSFCTIVSQATSTAEYTGTRAVFQSIYSWLLNSTKIALPLRIF